MSVEEQGQVPTNFREKLSKIQTGEGMKKIKDAVTPGSEDAIRDEDEQDEFEDEDEDEDEVEADSKPMKNITAPKLSSNDPLAALAEVSPGAKQFLSDFGTNWTNTIKKYTESDIIYLVEDKNGAYEKGGKRYKYRFKFQDPPPEEVEKIDVKFAKATMAETEVDVVKKLNYAYCYAFSKYYGCDIDIPKKYIGKALLRSIVDALNWLERQGFRPT